MAQADIIIADEKLLPKAVEVYNGVFRPKREVDYFKRRFMGRYNVLALIARIEGTGEGVVLIGHVGVTSHFGDLLRRARIPSRIEEPAS